MIKTVPDTPAFIFPHRQCSPETISNAPKTRSFGICLETVVGIAALDEKLAISQRERTMCRSRTRRWRRFGSRERLLLPS